MKGSNHKPVSAFWIRDESRSWADELLQVFELLFAQDAGLPVDKAVDQKAHNSHDVSN